jgi:Putative beta-barrel porin-2, OmpL-like. bbp2
MSLGWRVDAWYGSDSRWVQSQGWDDKWGSDVYTAFAMPQAYVELFLPGGDGATITAGRVWSPIGFEGVPAPDRFFLSATNLFMFAEPSTHTGVTVKYPVNEKWTVQAGVVQGWDASDFGGGCAFLGTVSWKGNEDKTTLTFVGYYGSETGDPHDRLFSTSTMLTHQLSSKLTYIMWSDFGNSQGTAVDSLGHAKNGQWLGVVNCLLVALNKDWSWGTRFEWFYDDDGTRIAEWREETLLGRGDVYTITSGLNYTPSPNWIIRPEVRYDWSSGVTPFDGMTRGDQFTAGVDCILRF